jgi:hypothetical protein
MRIRRFGVADRARGGRVPPGSAPPVAYLDRLADGRAGVIDDERLGVALEALLEEQRRRGSAADEALASGALIFITSAPGGRIEVRLGWLGDWRGENVRGHGMALGSLALADVVRGA